MMQAQATTNNATIAHIHFERLLIINAVFFLFESSTTLLISAFYYFLSLPLRKFNISSRLLTIIKWFSSMSKNISESLTSESFTRYYSLVELK